MNDAPPWLNLFNSHDVLLFTLHISLFLSNKLIATAVHSQNEARLFRIWFQLLS